MALWITKFAPDLMALPELHIAIAGAAYGQDSCDGGRWYQFIPQLLGLPALKVRVDLVGMEMCDSEIATGSFAGIRSALSGMPRPCAAAVKDFEPAGKYSQSLGAYLSNREGQRSPDLVFMFHPGFESHGPEWVQSGDLRMAISKGIPIGAAAFADDEHMLEIWMLDKYGYAAEGDPLVNPFCGRSFEGMPVEANFAKLLWKLAPTVPLKDGPLRSRNATKIRRYQEWGARQIAQGRSMPPMHAFGQRADGVKNVLTGETVDFIMLPSGLLVGSETGELWDDSNAGWMRPLDIEIPLDLMKAYPCESAFDFDRAIWALDVEDFIDREMDEEDSDDDFSGEASPFLFPASTELDSLMAEFSQLVTGYVAPLPTPGCDQFFSALQHEQWATAEALIAKRPELVHAVGPAGKTALFWAFDASNLEFAEKLLAAGARPSHQDDEGFTPLHDAARRRDAAAGALLLKWRADLNIRTGMGWSPLLTAMTSAASSLVGQLVVAGADLYQPNCVGMTPASIYEEVPLEPQVASLIRERLRG